MSSLDHYWMPFTANRAFKQAPRLLTRAEGMHYRDAEGRTILDGVAGLWCVNAGHGRAPIVQAIQAQAAEMDFAPPFQMGHPKAFELASAVAAIAPPGLDRVFFTNSGSEAVETALKIALAYQRLKGEASRTRLIGRERGYHGVNFGGISVGGMVANRKHFGSLLAGVDHLRHTHDLARNAHSLGLPQHGAELAEDLLRLIQLHDASTIAAVIVEPVAGSTGVLLPPIGYLQRLREICTQHGILLIFDEVITGFGRVGAPFAAQRFGVTPDLITCAKGLTNGAVPMGAVLASRAVHDAFMQGPPEAIELFHGYTYSAHPLACAAGLGHAAGLRGRGPAGTRAAAGARLATGHRVAARRAPCHRHAGLRPGGRHRAAAARRCAGRSRLRRIQGGLGEWALDPHHRRHHRAVAAAHRQRGPDRPDRGRRARRLERLA